MATSVGMSWQWQMENVNELDFHPGVKLAVVIYRNVKNSKCES